MDTPCLRYTASRKGAATRVAEARRPRKQKRKQRPRQNPDRDPGEGCFVDRSVVRNRGCPLGLRSRSNGRGRAGPGRGYWQQSRNGGPNRRRVLNGAGTGGASAARSLGYNQGRPMVEAVDEVGQFL
jgi:hypothetical protein